jgi:hypothetical protein
VPEEGEEENHGKKEDNEAASQARLTTPSRS